MRDQEMLDMLRRSPEKGMGLLMERYAGLVYAVARSRLPGGMFCAADVEGCVADAFSEFYLDLDSYDLEKGSIRSWLCVIARHNALDLARQRCREGERLLPLEDELAAAGGGLESGLEERELRRVVLEAVAELGEPDREIMLRKFYLGEPSAQIAARLGMTAGGVDTRTHRAVEKLRKKLAEWR
ncbi:MAG: sigma-70 family RNA polymerase sigma factor [Oscillospiraceae bacterium]|nr:sigma-70 family RNA polymerase sigma factor [Oscillospiraceae bacterium]